MAIKIIVKPDLEIDTFEEFCELYGPNAIAADGFVKVGPSRDLRRRCFNWNHHNGVSRADTYATCAQALTAVRYRIMDLFPRDSKGQVEVSVLFGDADQDTATTAAIIKNWERFVSPNDPLANSLVEVENRLDASLGAYPYGVDMPILRKVAWIYEPYDIFLKSGGKNRKNPHEYLAVMEHVEARIMAYLVGKGEELPVNASFHIERQVGINGCRVAEVVQTGPLGKMAAAAQGVGVGIQFRPRADGRTDVTGWLASPYVPCDSIWLNQHFNEIETYAEGGTWGGGDLIFASPRDKGTSVPKEHIFEVVAENVRSMVSA